MGIERVLLQTMKFDLQVDLPYQYLIDYSKKFKLTKPEVYIAHLMFYMFYVRH